MEHDRFDALTRSLGNAPRRTVLHAVIGATLGGALGLPSWLTPKEAAAKCVDLGKVCKKRGERLRCCGGAKCQGRRCRCTGRKVACGDRCVNPLTDPANCGQCGLTCASGKCVHGACTCDPFDNQCPTEVDGQCGCHPFVADPFEAACTDRNSACDLARPCDTNQDCPNGSVCLRGCSDPSDPQPNRCSKPCIPI